MSWVVTMVSLLHGQQERVQRRGSRTRCGTGRRSPHLSSIYRIPSSNGHTAGQGLAARTRHSARLNNDRTRARGCISYRRTPHTLRRPSAFRSRCSCTRCTANSIPRPGCSVCRKTGCNSHSAGCLRLQGSARTGNSRTSHTMSRCYRYHRIFGRSYHTFSGQHSSRTAPCRSTSTGVATQHTLCTTPRRIASTGAQSGIRQACPRARGRGARRNTCRTLGSELRGPLSRARRCFLGDTGRMQGRVRARGCGAPGPAARATLGRTSRDTLRSTTRDRGEPPLGAHTASEVSPQSRGSPPTRFGGR
jgi:hypothetical protein